MGDSVRARDETTGATALKPVTALHPAHDRQVWRLTVETPWDGLAAPEAYETTDDHPWRTVEGRWLTTAELRVGMLLHREDGAPARVLAVGDKRRVAATYHLEVADFHTYFVGEERMWVHNACAGGSGKPRIHNVDRSSRSAARDAALGETARGQSPMEHSNPTRGDPHFHAIDAQRNQITGVHNNYPK